MQHVFVARDAIEAHFVKSLLEQAGIAAVIENELIQQIRGDVPMTMETLPKLAVRDEDASAAQAVVNEFRARQKSPAPPTTERWHCACGEEHELQFSSCWHCGGARSDSFPPAIGTSG